MFTFEWSISSATEAISLIFSQGILLILLVFAGLVALGLMLRLVRKVLGRK